MQFLDNEDMNLMHVMVRYEKIKLGASGVETSQKSGDHLLFLLFILIKFHSILTD